MTSGALTDRIRRNRFMDAIQVWSSVFQRVLFMRSAIADDPTFAKLFKSHLDEEYGHDTNP